MRFRPKLARPMVAALIAALIAGLVSGPAAIQAALEPGGRRYLMVYVKGQMSELHRKSAEPIALQAGVPPRSLQAFLGLLQWDEDR